MYMYTFYLRMTFGYPLRCIVCTKAVSLNIREINASKYVELRAPSRDLFSMAGFLQKCHKSPTCCHMLFKCTHFARNNI